MTRECLATALELLGFIINLKSMLNLTQKEEFMGFQMDSQRMMISLPKQKVKSLRQRARHFSSGTGLGVRDSPDSWPNVFSPASDPPSTSILLEH